MRLVSLLPMLLATAAFAADGPLDGLVPAKQGNGLCYVRAYSDAHLADHPGQQTLAALVSWRYEGADAVPDVRIQLQLRGSRLLHILGSCSWNEHANIDTSGNRMLATFKGAAAYDCLAVTAPGSAEEAGYFILEPRDGGKTVLFHVDTPFVTVSPKNKPGTGGSVDFGVEDRVFKLERTERSVCAPLDAAIDPL